IGDGLKWSGATRSSAYIRTGLQWPDIELENMADLWTVLQGTNVPIRLRFQNSFSNYVVTVDFGFDNDRNPYNNAAANIIGTFSYAIDSSSGTNVLFSLSPTIAANGRYLYGKITDYKGYARYYYLSRPFHVLSTMPR